MKRIAHHRLADQNLLIAVMLTLISIAAFIAGLQIEKDPGGGWGARIFPLGGASVLLIVGLMELRHALTGQGFEKKQAAPGVWMLLGLALGYIWLIGKVGYLISTALAAPLALWMFGIRRPVGLLLAAILCPAIYHLVFFEFLGVFPPYGEWFDLLDIIKGY